MSAADVKLVRELFLEGLALEEIAAKFEREPLDIAEAVSNGAALLIAGALAYICDGCLDICIQIVKEEKPEMLLVNIGVARDEQN